MEKNYYPLELKGDKIIGSITQHPGQFWLAACADPLFAKQLIEAYNEKYEPKSSAHSFTEGADHTPETKASEDCPSIDEQVKFIDELFKLSRGERSRSDWRMVIGHKNTKDFPYNKSEKIYLSIKENLQAIKRWNESPAYNGKIDVAKVIEDLLDLAKFWGNQVAYQDEYIDRKVAIQNAEATLGMLQAFKQERKWKPIHDKIDRAFTVNTDSSDFHAGMNFRKKDDDEKIKQLIAFTEDKIGTKIQWNDEHLYWQQVKPEFISPTTTKRVGRAEVDIVEEHQMDTLRNFMVQRLVDVHGRYAIADTIIFAIKEFLKIKA